MERIPAEVLDLVIEGIASQETSLWTVNALNRPIADLKALRLCSRRLADQVAPYLFDDLFVFVTLESLVRMTAIANHPHYRHFVKEVRVFPRHFALESPFEDKSAYEHYVMDLAMWYRDTGAWKRREKSAITTEQIDRGYDHYVRQRDAQSELLPHFLPLLRDAFTKFPSLRSVVASQFRDESYHGQPCYPQSRFKLTPNLFSSHRQTLLNLSGDRLVRHSDPQPLQWESTEETVMVLLVTASSKKNIHSLRLCDGMRHPDLSLDELSDDEYTLARNMFANLKTLVFPFPGGFLQPATQAWTDLTASSARWLDLLSSASNLETLTLPGSPLHNIEWCVGVEQIYSSAYFPRRRRLKIVDFPASSASVVQITNRHASTLEKLTLEEMRLGDGSWHDVFSAIRRKGLEIEALCLISVNHYLEYFDTGQKGADENKLLNAFIQGDQPWPSELPRGLSVDAQEEVFPTSPS